MDKPGFYKGRPLSDYAEEIMTLERNKEIDKAEELLLNLVDATDEASWFHLELAKIYHKRGEYQAEIAILERACNLRHPPGVTPRKLMKRLEQVRQAAGSPSPLSKTADEVANEVIAEFAAWQKELVNKEYMDRGEPRSNKLLNDL